MRARERQVRGGVFPGSHIFPIKEVVRDVEAAAAGDRPTLDCTAVVASLGNSPHIE